MRIMKKCFRVCYCRVICEFEPIDLCCEVCEMKSHCAISCDKYLTDFKCENLKKRGKDNE